MSANESIIAVPINVEQPNQTRQFLVRLVEKLDIVLGYRGGDPYVSLSQLSSTASSTNENLTQLEKTVLSVITALLSENSEVLTDLITGVITGTEEAIDGLKSASAIGDNDVTTQTISNPPTQAEVQSIQDQVVANGTDFNDLLIALRATGIIAT